MASIKTRIAGLEQASKVNVQRQLTDAERAVRVAHILNNPECSAMYGQLVEFLKQTAGVSEFLCKRFGLQLTEMRSPN